MEAVHTGDEIRVIEHRGIRGRCGCSNAISGRILMIGTAQGEDLPNILSAVFVPKCATKGGQIIYPEHILLSNGIDFPPKCGRQTFVTDGVPVRENAEINEAAFPYTDNVHSAVSPHIIGDRAPSAAFRFLLVVSLLAGLNDLYDEAGGSTARLITDIDDDRIVGALHERRLAEFWKARRSLQQTA